MGIARVVVDEKDYLWFCRALRGGDDGDDVILEAGGYKGVERWVGDVGLEGEERGGDAVLVRTPSFGRLRPLRRRL